MRKSLARLLIAFVLALTVPLQGIAAVSAGVCMALGHHGEAAPGAHHHADSAAHHHGGESGSERGGEAHCPPCVSCCAAAAIVAFSFTPPPDPARVCALDALLLSFSGVTPERLDRPPLAL